jgi:hypothetical protein
MLDSAFPPGKTAVVPGPNPDNPYPLNVLKPEVPVSARVFWRMNPGRNAVNLNWNAISADSVVMISASEYNANSQKLPDGSHQRFVGAANVTVSNVTPHGPPFDPNHGVTFVVDVAWNAPLTICTDIAIINNAPEAVVYVGPGIASNQLIPQVEDFSGGGSPAVRTTLEAHLEGSVPGQGGGSVTRHEATITTRGRRGG